VPCHCLLIEDNRGLALVDTGIGVLDCRQPVERIGQQLIDLAGFLFDEADTAVRQIERLGRRPADVVHVILTHGDPDHAGGLADFPDAQVYVATEELAAIKAGDPRYRLAQFAHGPRWIEAASSRRRWFGLEARPLPLGFQSEVLLVPLFGHTLGNSGVAIQQGERWLLHVGDAYYLRVELAADDHPVSAITALRAADDAQRRESLEFLRRLFREHHNEVEMIGYHDIAEFPA
jgi:glyoxylase-like metal-dependent hydrolase (beta-lactamase superfamily II)